MDELVYPVGTRVRLTSDVGDAHCGAEGVVIGYYRRDTPAYAVTIAGTPVAIPPACVAEIANDGS